MPFDEEVIVLYEFCSLIHSGNATGLEHVLPGHLDEHCSVCFYESDENKLSFLMTT